MVQKLGNDPVKNSKNTMLIPMLKKVAAKFHQAYDGHKAKAFKHEEAEKEQIYRIKSKGQWSLAKSVGSNTLPPLTAVKRKQKRTKGAAGGIHSHGTRRSRHHC